MAYANGTLFVPVVNAASVYNQFGMDPDAGLDIVGATGEMVAINVVDGSVKWQAEIPSMTIAAATVANDLVFTGALDGVFRAYNTETGEKVWSAQLTAGLNAPPAIAGDMIFIGAGGALIPSADSAENIEPGTGLVAFKIGGASADTTTTRSQLRLWMPQQQRRPRRSLLKRRLKRAPRAIPRVKPRATSPL